MSSTSTLSEKIVLAVGTGRDPTEIDTLEAITASSTELNVLTGATNANSGTGKAVILGTSGALTIPGTLTLTTAATVGTTLGVTGLLTTAGIATAPVVVGDVTTYAVLAADSGKLHIIPDLTSSCTFTLPAGAAGLNFEFIGNGIALDAQNWVFDSPAGVFYRGGVTHLDLDAGAGADELVSVFPNGSSHIHLTVTTPSPVSRIKFVWDGTRYVVNGLVHSNTAPAFS